MKCPKCGLVEFEQNFRRHLSDYEYHETDYDTSFYTCPSCGATLRLILAEEEQSQ